MDCRWTRRGTTFTEGVFEGPAPVAEGGGGVTVAGGGGRATVRRGGRATVAGGASVAGGGGGLGAAKLGSGYWFVGIWTRRGNPDGGPRGTDAG